MSAQRGSPFVGRTSPHRNSKRPRDVEAKNGREFIICVAERTLRETPTKLVPSLLDHAEVNPLLSVHLGDLYTENGQTLQGSFPDVSKPNFPSKCSLESSRRDLHNALLCTVLESFTNLKNFVKNC